MAQPAAAWTPGPEVNNHRGQPLPTGRLFFAPPPPAIGTVPSAWSTLAESTDPNPLEHRLKTAAVGCGLGGCLGLLFPPIIPLTALVGALLSFFMDRKEQTCTYIGENGLARIPYHRKPERARATVLVFSDASELITEETVRRVNFAYQDTSYHYRWSNPLRVRLAKIEGKYAEKHGNPPPEHEYWFARAAEATWTRFMLPRALAEVTQKGGVSFNTKNGTVGVGQGFLDLALRGQVYRCASADLAGMEIKEGTLTILPANPRIGFFRTEYAGIANARLFLALVDQLVGLRPAP